MLSHQLLALRSHPLGPASEAVQPQQHAHETLAQLQAALAGRLALLVPQALHLSDAHGRNDTWQS